MNWDNEIEADMWGEGNELARDYAAEMAGEASMCPNCGGTEWFQLSEGGELIEVCVECGRRVVSCAG